MVGLMSVCPQCSGPLDSSGRCQRCGTGRVDATPATEMLSELSPAEVEKAAATDHFAPGTILAERYRIVALLGRGGMGHVYRAEDMKLGQTVALKFLPPALTDNPRYLEIMLSEVRLARQVSSPYVCRVHDVVEADGLRFLTMEYVDGENLAGLLKRIGRLPPDRGQEIAWQVCEGLAAAHAMGVLHRDLKPANLMIDGQGRPKITDFGLALETRDAATKSEVAGTPGYIAPEVAQGKAVSVQSDLYGLGAILYEIYTGHRAVDDGLGKSAHGTASARTGTVGAGPPKTGVSSRGSGSFPRDVPKPVQQAILQCLEADPAKRPRSAKEVAAAFPTQDALAMAEAAGETPSPEMIAAAGSDEPLALWKAWGLLLVLFASIAGLPYAAPRILSPVISPFVVPPGQFESLARTMVQQLGYTTPPADAYSYFIENQHLIADHLRRIDRGVRTPGDSDYGPGVKYAGGYEQGLYLFQYRERADGLLSANDPWSNLSWNDPAIDEPGMINLEMDSRGHLTNFLAVPPKEADTQAGGQEPDWRAAFAAAGLDASKMQVVAPTVVPVVASDWRREWQGKLAGYPAVTVRVAVTGYEGKLTSFRVIAPWDEPGSSGKALLTRWLVIWTALTGAGSFVVVFFAIRNIRRGRADLSGALRLGLTIFGLVLIAHLLGMRWQPDIEIMSGRILAFVGQALVAVVICGGAYLAIEPYLRRKMPRLLVGWMQLLKGQWQSPRMGRDILVGLALAAMEIPFGTLFIAWNEHIKSGINFPVTGLGLNAMYQPMFWLSTLLGSLCFAIFLALFVLSVYFMLRSIFRVNWLASLALLVFFFFFGGGPPHFAQLSFIVLNLSIAVLETVCVLRFGLLAMVAFTVYTQVFLSAPITFDFSQWFTPAAMANLAVVLGIAGYGFWIAIGEQRMFGSFKLDD